MRLLPIILIGGVIASCSDQNTLAPSRESAVTAEASSSGPPVARIRIDPWSIDIKVGEAKQMNAVLWDAQGNVLEGRVITWNSNRQHVKVDANGVVTATDSGAVATITATSEGQQALGAVRITGRSTTPTTPVASVSVAPTQATISVGATTQLTATARDAAGNPLAGRTATWSSSNTAVATVNSSGVVTGVAQGGATITATSEGRSGAASITVTTSAPVPVASVSVSPAADTLQVGQTQQLTATARDANGNVLTGRAVTWSSSNTAVATVSSTGLVRAVAAGSASIRATSEGRTGTSAITVTAAPPTVATVTISPSSASVEQGATVQLTATARNASGTAIPGQVFTWSSTNTAVATVNSSGVVSGVGAGTATIRATTSGVTGNATVTVSSAPPPPPPPPSGGQVLLQSDWRTQIGNTTTALSDGGKWNQLSSGAEQNASIVDAPSGFSTHKVLRVRSESGHRDGWVEPRRTGLGQIPVGSTRNYRWEIAFHEPALSDRGQHPIQDGGGVSSSNWYLGTTNSGNNLGSNQWGIDFIFGGDTWDDSKWTLGQREGSYTPLTKGVVYRMEVQLARISQSQFRFNVWIHDSSGRLLYDCNAIRVRNGSRSLCGYVHTFQNPANADIFLAGLNGISSPVNWPVHSSDQAAFAVVQGLTEGQQIGPYGSVQGEVRR